MAPDVERTPCRVVGVFVKVRVGLTPPAPSVPSPPLMKLMVVFVLLRANPPKLTAVAAPAPTGCSIRMKLSPEFRFTVPVRPLKVEPAALPLNTNPELPPVKPTLTAEPSR